MSLLMYDNEILGYKESNVTYDFIGSDSEKLFKFNLNKRPDEWYYRTHPISYIYNKNGHRCKNIENINFDNYVLFAGDSHAEGVGLELETTYAYVTSKKLDVDYYNFGLGGTGLDYMFYNVVTWIQKYPPPKHIFMYWTDISRYTKITEYPKLSSILAGVYDTDHDERMLVYGSGSNYFKTRTILYEKMLNNILTAYNIPYTNFTILESEIFEGTETIKFLFRPDREDEVYKFDRARDEHVGLQTHDKISEILVRDYLDKYLNARVYNDSRGQSTSEGYRNNIIELSTEGSQRRIIRRNPGFTL